MAEELNITIRAKDEASATLQKVAGAVDQTARAADGAKSSAEGFGVSIGALVAGVGTLVGAVGGLAAAFGVVDVAINAALTGIDRGGAFDDMSKKIGVSIESLSRMDIAATVSGVSLQLLGNSFKKLSINMVEAASGGEAQAAAFAALGVSVTDASGKVRDSEEVLLDLADAFSRAEPSAQRTALAMEIFGKAGAEMMPFLLEGKEGLGRFAEINDKLGLTLQRETNLALEVVGDSLAILGRVSDGVAQQFAIGLAPALEEITSGLVDFVAEVGIGDGTIAGFGAAIGEGLRSAFESASQQLRELKEIFTTLEWDDAMSVMGARLNRALEAAFESAIWAAGRAAKNVFEKVVAWVFNSVDVAAVAKLSNEKIIREELATLEQQLRTRVGNDTSQASNVAQYDAQVRQLVEGIGALKGRLGELHGEQLVADAAAAKSTQGLIDQQVAANLDALGLGAAADSWRFYSEKGVIALPVVQKNTEAEKEKEKAVESATKAVESATDALLNQVAATESTTAAQETRNTVIEQGIEAGDSYATILTSIEDAELANEAATLLASGATLAAVDAYVKAEQGANQAAESTKKWNEALEAVDAVGKMKEEIGIWEQVRDGVISVEEAHRKLAIAKERDRGLSQKQAEEYVNLTGTLDDLRDKYGEVEESSLDLWSNIDDAFSQMMDGLIQGTLDMSDIWKSFSQGMLKEIVNSLGGMSGLFKSFVGWLGGLFNGGGGGGGGGGGILSGLLGGSGGGSLGGLLSLGVPLALGAGGFFENPTVSIAINSLSLLNSGVGLATGGIGAGGGLIGALFGPGVGATTLGSIIGPTGSGLVTSLFGSGSESVLGTSLGAIGSTAGAVLGGAGGAYGVWNLVQGGQSGIEIAASLIAIVAGGAAILNAFPVIGTIIYAIILALTAIASAFTDITPTAGTLRRRAAEALLDQTKTFDELQDKYGDLTRTTSNLGSAPGLIGQRERLGAENLNVIQGFATIFGQLAFGNAPGTDKRVVADVAYQWTNILTDFFSRMGGESAVVAAEIRKNLLSAFRDLGINDAAKAFELLNEAAGPILFSHSNFQYLEEAVDPAMLLGATIRGVGSIFESELPAGVHIAALALESMKNEGVAMFGDLDTVGRETLLNLSQDAENFDAVVAQLFKNGFKIDTEEFKTRLQDITASASFIGENIGAIFTSGSVSAGIDAMMQKLQASIKESVVGSQLKTLFEETNIAASFEPVFAQLRLLNEDSSLAGTPEFTASMVQAIAEGRANLQDYIPMLQEMRETSEAVAEALAEAFKPDPIEQFWTTMADLTKENQAALDAYAASLFQVASTAEFNGDGQGQQAARDAMQERIDQQSFGAAQAAATLAATNSPQSAALAALTTEFQYKVAAALQDGVLSGTERADLQGLKVKLDAAGQAFADSVSSGAGALADLFSPDKLKASVNAAAEALKGAVGGAAGSMFDVIQQGGSKAEGIKAFGESFKSSVKENILAGMQEALVQSAIMEGALAQQMGALKEVIKGALVGGISESEQAVIDQMIGNINTLTDQTLAELQPTLDSMAGTAEKLVNGTDKTVENLDDIKTASDDATSAVDDAATKATENLGSLATAMDPQKSDAIKDGVDAMTDALGAGGTTNEGLKAALLSATGALGTGIGDQSSLTGALSSAVGALSGSGNDALTGALSAASGALSGGDSALTGAVGAAFSALAGGGDGTLVNGAGAAAAALKDNLAAGLLDAQDGLGQFADLLRNFQLPIGNSAKGGSFKRGMSFVGEEGMELVVANEGGGFTVIPLNGVPHAAQGIKLDENGNPVDAGPPPLIPIGVRKPSRGWGYGGPIIEGPWDPRHPDYKDPRDDDGEGGGEQSVSVSFNFAGALDDFFRGGTRKELREALAEATGEGIFQGMLDGLLKYAGLDDFQKKMGETIEDAFADGKVSAEELADIVQQGMDFKKKLRELARDNADAFAAIAEQFGLDLKELGLDPVSLALEEELGPEFERIAAEFGLDLGEDTYKNLLAGAEAGANAIGGALRSVLNDPANLTMENLTVALKTEIYRSVSQGLIDAFIQSAVIQGALAIPLGIIQTTFAAVAAGQMNAAEANVVIAEQVAGILEIINGEGFKAMLQPMLDGLKQLGADLGQTGDAVQDTVPPFQDAAQAAEDACTGQCDLEYKLVQAQLGIGNLTGEGGAGVFGVEYYEPQRKFARGGFVRGTPRGVRGIFGEDGDEVVLPLEGSEAQAALAAAAAGFASASIASGLSSASGALEAEATLASVAEMTAALKEQQAAQRASDAELRATLAATVAALTERPVSVEIDGVEIVRATVDHLERRSRGGSATLSRVR